MSDSNILSDLRKAKEDEYFHQKEKELIEKMRQRALKEQERQELSEFFLVENAEILDDLQQLGYSRDTIFLLFLVPVIHVGWIDGQVTEQEREAILKIARQRGLEAGAPAEAMLLDWLNKRPSDEFFEKTLRLIRNILETRPPDGTEHQRAKPGPLLQRGRSCVGRLSGLRQGVRRARGIDKQNC